MISKTDPSRVPTLESCGGWKIAEPPLSPSSGQACRMAAATGHSLILALLHSSHKILSQTLSQVEASTVQGQFGEGSPLCCLRYMCLAAMKCQGREDPPALKPRPSCAHSVGLCFSWAKARQATAQSNAKKHRQAHFEAEAADGACPCCVDFCLGPRKPIVTAIDGYCDSGVRHPRGPGPWSQMLFTPRSLLVLCCPRNGESWQNEAACQCALSRLPTATHGARA